MLRYSRCLADSQGNGDGSSEFRRFETSLRNANNGQIRPICSRPEYQNLSIMVSRISL